MLTEKAVSQHYLHGNLLIAIENSLSKLGKSTDNVSIDDLAPVDEFHIGGRMATENLLQQMDLPATSHILDIGCGLGGASRFVAFKYGSRVTGIDLTPEYIETGNMLNTWVHMDDQITLKQGNALSMPFADESFDGCYMMHVGMNIKDKSDLFSEVFRVLKPGSSFGIYDIMRHKDGELSYPLPWASESSTSVLATADEYRQTLTNTGFQILAQNNRKDFAIEFFRAMKARTEANGGPPPLGLHTLMQESTPIKLKNMVDNIQADLIAPVEMIARK